VQLKYKSALFFTPFITLPLLIVGVIAYFELKEINEIRAAQQSTVVLEQTLLGFSDKIQVAQANIKLFSDNPLLKQYALISDDETRYALMLAPLLALFGDIQRELPDYYEIKFVLPDGYEDAIRLQNGIDNHSEEMEELSYFSDILSAQSIFTTLIQDENTGAPAILLANPISLRDPAKQGVVGPPALRGFLILHINLSYLQAQIDQYTLSDSGFLAVTDTDNRLLLFPAGRDRRSREHVSGLVKRDANTSGKATNPLIHYQGMTYLTKSMDMPAGLRLFAIVPEDEILKESRQIGNLVILVTVIAIAISLLFIFFILKRLIIQPVEQLSDAAERIGYGKIGLQIELQRNDEIGTLAHSLNAMSKNLELSLERIHYIANHDALTDLPNRTMFNHYFDCAVATANINHHKIALLFFDLDDFKQVNDSLGHEAGDALLQELAERLVNSLRQKRCNAEMDLGEPCDLLARLGGDEFVILLNHINSPMDAATVAERVLLNMSKPVSLHAQELHVSCSLGITIFPNDATTVSELTKYADVAMYHAKDNGKNNYQFYSAEMNARMLTKLHLKARLKTALAENQFVLHYQPQVNPVSGQIISAEALIRWNDPENGLLYPDAFIGTAEESGLITPMTEWVLQEACRQNLAWQAEGLPRIPVSVNVSSIQFKRRDLVEMVESCLEASGIDASYLELELTESSLLQESTDAIATLQRLADLGVRVALDDFGTGYSSLSYLEKFPIQILKIDRSFVLTINDDSSEKTIISAIIALGHALHLRIVAEGVDDETQLDYLCQQGCDLIQGYLFSKPLPAERFGQLLKRGKLLRVA
jgi:diguanylate cyclase (GGDEF)-like protein